MDNYGPYLASGLSGLLGVITTQLFAGRKAAKERAQREEERKIEQAEVQKLREDLVRVREQEVGLEINKRLWDEVQETKNNLEKIFNDLMEEKRKNLKLESLIEKLRMELNELRHQFEQLEISEYCKRHKCQYFPLKS